MIRRYLSGALLLFFLSCGAPVIFAQDTDGADDGSDERVAVNGEEDEDSVASDEDRHLNLVMEKSFDEDNPDYDELYKMRNLERAIVRGGDDDDFVEVINPFDDPMGLVSGPFLSEYLGKMKNGTPQIAAESREEALKAALAQIRELKAAKDKDIYLPFGIDCLDEKSVKEYIALYTSPGAKTFRVWLARSGKWRDIILPILEEEKVPADLFYLAMIESGFKTSVRSPANAGGMWQFIPSTGMEQGLRIDEYVDERNDPIKATRAAAGYLKKQYERFNSWPLAMAAYNAGAGAVSAAMVRYSTNNYFALVEYGALYDETRRYVPKILAAALIAENPSYFGFEGVKREEKFSFDAVMIDGKTALKNIASAAGTDLGVIRALNPELLSDTTPDGAYKIRIPAGSLKKFTENYDKINKIDLTQYTLYKVRVGEDIETIAEDFSLNPRTLRYINRLSYRENPEYLSQIRLPKDAVRSVRKSDEPLTLPSAQLFDYPDKEAYFYKVLSGDSLRKLSEFFQISRTQLAIWNNLDPSAYIRKGMILRLYFEKSRNTDDYRLYSSKDVRLLVVGSESYLQWRDEKKKTERKSQIISITVRKGDTLSKIAKKYGTTTENLQKWNNLKKSTVIKKGMRLVVKK